jgi:RNA polymerase sigma factor (sigma-70 family)
VTLAAHTPGGLSASAPRHVGTMEFAALYEKHRTPLLLFCTARTGNPDVAEDVVQEVFVRAFAVRDRYDPSRPFWPWIASIAARECVDTHRRHARAEARLADLAASSALGASEDNTSASVLRKLEQEQVERGLASLPPRQRTALLLFAADGWSYAEVAAQLGTSADVVRQLIVRARTKLRSLGARACTGALGLARMARERLHRWATGPYGGWVAHDPLAGWAQGMLAHSAVAGAMLFALLGAALAPLPTPTAATPSMRAQAVGSAEGPISPQAQRRAAPAGARQSAPPNVQAPGARRVAGDVERRANELAASVLPASDEGDPERIRVSDIAVSPGYEEDRTVFVAGYSEWPHVATAPLLVSRDGGASWHRPRAAGVGGNIVQLLLPPAYPHDQRLFAVTSRGLQVSRDDGDTFKTLVPTGVVEGVLSPAFNRGDPSMLLVAGGQLLEYRVDTGLARPVVVGDDRSGSVTSAAYGANYPDDPMILVASRVLSGTELRLRFSRCTRTATSLSVAERYACATTELPDPRSEHLRVIPPSSAQPDVVWLLNVFGVYVSRDGGRSFAQTRLGRADAAATGSFDTFSGWDLTPVGTGGRSAILAQESLQITYSEGTEVDRRPNPPLLRTDDAGQTWTPVEIGLPGFDTGRTVAVTPTGRIFAGGNGNGLACSVDGGDSWTTTCPTTDTR